jgi:hypothetical protein
MNTIAKLQTFCVQVNPRSGWKIIIYVPGARGPPTYLEVSMKRIFLVVLALSCLVGCSGGRAINVPGLKAGQQQRNKANSNAVKDQTGVDLGTATPVPGKKRNPLTTAPIE